jgi:hypothetical protein
LQHEHEIKAGHMLIEAEYKKHNAEYGGNDQHCPRGSSGDEAGAGPMTAQVGRVHPQEGKRENGHDCFAEKRFARRGETGNGKPDED